MLLGNVTTSYDVKLTNHIWCSGAKFRLVKNNRGHGKNVGFFNKSSFTQKLDELNYGVKVSKETVVLSRCG